MAITLEAVAKGTNQTGSSITSLASSAVATTTGWLAVVMIRVSANTRTISAPTDTANNIYTLLPNTLAGNDADCYLQLAYCENITGNAANVVTAHFSSGPYDSVLVLYFSGIAASSSLDASTNGAGNGTSVTSGTFSTGQADEVIVAGMSYGNNNATFSAGLIAGSTGTLGVTSGASNQGDSGMEYRIVSATQTNVTAAMTIGASQNFLAIGVATFKMAAAGGISIPVAMHHYKMMRGA